MSGDILALALPLCAIIAGLVFAIIYLERVHRQEREAQHEQFTAEREHLIEVALAPGAVQMAAMQAAMPEPSLPPQDEYDEAILPSADFDIADRMEVS